ncbi:hypothetical protein M407DRAFT_203577 [Tulasnella calospora MUT 4182]|uniref:Uncharacterized protein n=1 Tax=Tulasnella calospora MUT 4182 TaxID=1051891 RepID=A0A0C3KXJ9_9AGAM|nr:hypothetical protein M407DRAFT_203577 [Tulasnella calospora MUT 4182]
MGGLDVAARLACSSLGYILSSPTHSPRTGDRNDSETGFNFHPTHARTACPQRPTSPCLWCFATAWLSYFRVSHDWTDIDFSHPPLL